MSATVYWQPSNPEVLEGASTSAAESLRKVFGDFPITLTYDHLEKLNTMAAMYSAEPNPFEALANEIVKFGAIVLTVSY